MASREASGGHAWGVPRPDKTGQRSGMGCISSKAFKGEGQRLGTAPTASTKGPQRVVAQRISPSTAIPGQQAPKPTNKTGGSGPSDDMRSAAARAAAQRADSVSRAVCDVPDQPMLDRTRHLSHGVVTHELLQQVRRGTSTKNPNAGKLSDKLQEQNRKATLPPPSQRDEPLTVRTWCPFMFFPIGMKSDACAVGLGRALRADRTLVLHSHLYWYPHVMHMQKYRLYIRYSGAVFKS